MQVAPNHRRGSIGRQLHTTAHGRGTRICSGEHGVQSPAVPPTCSKQVLPVASKRKSIARLPEGSVGEERARKRDIPRARLAFGVLVGQRRAKAFHNLGMQQRQDAESVELAGKEKRLYSGA